MKGKLPKESTRSVEFPCLKVEQPLGTFFIGSIEFGDLCDIAHFDVRRVIQESRDVEMYLGIQRPLIEKRVKELEKYVNFQDASFPTSIILAVDEKCAEFFEKESRLRLSNYLGDDDNEPILYRHIARVLDGQHRIAGLYECRKDKFDVPVSIFVGMDIADQAYLFATVNLEQTKVNRSLAYDLFALAKTRSPYKTCHNIAVALDQDEQSPFHKRIKRLGVATPDRRGETLSQATVVAAILDLISEDPKTDRDKLRKGKKLELASSDKLDRRPLRNLFIQKRDLEIVDLIRNYFQAVKERWPEAWDYGGKGRILNKTNGFRAAMRVFPKAYLFVAAPGDPVDVQSFKALFDRSKMKDHEFTTEEYVPGSSGAARLARRWLEEMGIE